MRVLFICRLLPICAAVVALANGVQASTWKAGAASVNITPNTPVVLLGYSNRPGPFEWVAGEIFAKALAIEDEAGKRAVIITADLVGFQAAVTTDPVSQRIREKLGLEPSQLLFNASHAHTAPLVSLHPHLTENVGHPQMSAEDAANTIEYTRRLQDQLVAVIETAVNRLEPAVLSWGSGKIDFPMNRRFFTPAGVAMMPNPSGPVDRAVPVLRVQSPDGELRAVVFGTACHNTTLTINEISGDYAGYAQAELEAKHPGAAALFMQGCGADANPHPTGGVDQAKAHGNKLAQEVDRLLTSKLSPLSGPLALEYAIVDLELEHQTPELLEAYSKLPNFQARQAIEMRRVIGMGKHLPKSYPAPVAVWQFGTGLTLVALPAEPVAEYVALIQERIGSGQLWVAGYNNDCFGYLPTAAVVRQGGHEAIGITLWGWGEDLVGRIGFFQPSVQDVILNTVAAQVEAARRSVDPSRK